MTYELDKIYLEIKNLNYDSQIEILNNYKDKKDLDFPSRSLIYTLIGKLLVKKGENKYETIAEHFEKAGSLLETYWISNHISNLKKSAQRKILLEAIKNYSLADRYYFAKNLKISSTRVQIRIRDLKDQLKFYPSVIKKLGLFFVFFSFISSIFLFSHNLTGFSIADTQDQEDFVLGGIFLLIAIIGGVYILFFITLYYAGDILWKI